MGLVAAMKFIFNDGGRAEAGFKGRAPGDCVTRAIAIATGRTYQDVYDDLNRFARSNYRHARPSTSRTGINPKTTRDYLSSLGWDWNPVMKIGSGCKVHMQAGELPSGRIIVKLTGHVCAVIDGVQNDLSDNSRDGQRCVYGYWTSQ